MPLPRQILSVATNCRCRAIREEILTSAAYAVKSPPSTSEALQILSGNGYAFDLVVVCDCVPAEERLRFIATIKATSPNLPILLIGANRDSLVDDLVTGYDEPTTMLSRVANLLAA